ncbi:MAG: pyridoxamine 5'-phosphate oxidase [Schleiferiaceae bacterium]|jgi:pyridoxamine 5'-phosphate oxidase|nr:pyridoxamine 5'-phosphate oxidase [Schleiferiaceae bacterium]
MSTEKDFRDLRTDYSWGALEETSALQNPFDQFNKWYEEYAKLDALDSTAVTISTVDSAGVPDARVVLLKEVREGNFIFYTNHNSKKGKDLKQNPNVHLLFFWPEMERQIRIKGTAIFMEKEESEIYFNKRPFESRVAAAISPQSEVVPNREYLEEKFFNVLKEKEENDTVEMPKQWGGVKIAPQEFEFWQGRISRLHDRLRYLKVEGNWKIERLAP